MDLKTLFGLETNTKKQVSPSTVLTRNVVTSVPSAATLTKNVTALPEAGIRVSRVNTTTVATNAPNVVPQNGQILPFPGTIRTVPAPQPTGPQPTISTNRVNMPTTAPNPNTSFSPYVPPQATGVAVDPAAPRSAGTPSNPESAVPSDPAASVVNVDTSTLPAIPGAASAGEQAFVPMTADEMAPTSMAARIMQWFNLNKKKIMWGAIAVVGVVVGAKVWKKVRK